MAVCCLTVEIGRRDVDEECERQTLSRLLVVNHAVVMPCRLVSTQLIAQIRECHREKVVIVEMYAITEFTAVERTALVLRTNTCSK